MEKRKLIGQKSIVENNNPDKNSIQNHGKRWKKTDENILFKVADKEIKNLNTLI